MKRWALWVAVCASLCGAILALLSTSQHLRVQREGFEQASYCSINEFINCDVVNASSYATVAGVPLAWWGLVLYLVILGMTAWALASRTPRVATITFAWFLSLGAVAYSVRMAFVLVNVLGVLCLECLGMYVVNLILFLTLFGALGVGLKAFPRSLKEYLRLRPQWGAHIVVVAIAFGLGWVTISGVQASREEKSVIKVSLAEKLRAFDMGSIYPVEVDPRWPVWGNPEAEVVIVEFSDFECPFCKLAAFHLRPYLQEFREQVQLRFAHFPLDPECNSGGHRHACLAARATICAQARGDFWGFHDDLFRHQRQLSRETIVKLASQRGWNGNEFSVCLDAPETKVRLDADIAAASKLYVNSTPTIIVNGRNLRYWRDGELLQAVVKRALQK